MSPAFALDGLTLIAPRAFALQQGAGMFAMIVGRFDKFIKDLAAFFFAGLGIASP
jgi:hypothetical protein